MSRPAPSTFKVGKVQGYLRGQVWYLCYHEHGRRHRPRIGPDLQAAKQLAAQVNAQLAVGSPAALSFEPVSVPELRRRWLDHHEHVLRSSTHTVARYRTATDHLLRFLGSHPVRHASHFTVGHAGAFARHLRTIEVSPNGHANTPKRALMDKGLKYVLECCRALFAFAAKRRHLPPYADNPFSAMEVDRIPVERARPIVLLTAEQERAFLEACDDWQFPLFLTLLLTGLRPGEVCHLLLPDDLDLEARVVRVRNKPGLGWQVKTRNERDVPLVPALADILRMHLGGRNWGAVICRRRWPARYRPGWAGSAASAERELHRRHLAREAAGGNRDDPKGLSVMVRGIWRDLGAVEPDRVRAEFIRVACRIGLADYTAPKILRHMFATALQDARVDPLIRNLLMGHATAGVRAAGHGLGMTAVYSHSRPDTIRRQLEEALAGRPCVATALNRMASRTATEGQ
jgi:integrase